LGGSLLITQPSPLPPREGKKEFLNFFPPPPQPEMVSFTPRLLYLSERAYGIQ